MSRNLNHTAQLIDYLGGGGGGMGWGGVEDYNNFSVGLGGGDKRNRPKNFSGEVSTFKFYKAHFCVVCESAELTFQFM